MREENEVTHISSMCCTHIQTKEKKRDSLSKKGVLRWHSRKVSCWGREVGLQRETRQKKRWHRPPSHKTEEKENHSCKLNTCLAKESENK